MAHMLGQKYESNLASQKPFEEALDTLKRALDFPPLDNGLRLSLDGIAMQTGDKALARRSEVECLLTLAPKFSFLDKVMKIAKSL